MEKETLPQPIEDTQPLDANKLMGVEETKPDGGPDSVKTIINTDAGYINQTKLKQELANLPTNVPKNFYEQFEMYNGNVYANVNGSWVNLGGLGSVATTPAGGVGTNYIQKDVWVNSDEATTTYNQDNYISINRRTGTQVITHNALMYVNLSRLNGTTVSSATLYIYVNLYSEWTTKNLNIGRITQDWDVNTVTWNTKPTYSGSTTKNLTSSDTGWQTVDITTLVNSWLAGTYSNFGIYLSCDTGTDNQNEELQIASVRATSNQPYILIT